MLRHMRVMSLSGLWHKPRAFPLRRTIWQTHYLFIASNLRVHAPDVTEVPGAVLNRHYLQQTLVLTPGPHGLLM